MFAVNANVIPRLEWGSHVECGDYELQHRMFVAEIKSLGAVVETTKEHQCRKLHNMLEKEKDQVR